MLVRYLGILVIAVCLVVCRVEKSMAARGLLLVRNMHQWYDFQYRFDQYKTESGRSTMKSDKHRLENSYHFDTLYAVLHANLLTGRFAMDLGFDYDWQKKSDEGSDSGTDLEIEYDLDGVFLKEKPCPVDFTSYGRKNTINRVFSDNYDVTSWGNGIGISLENDYLPTRIRYSMSESETDGLTADRTSKIEHFLFTASHRYQSFSSTSFNFMEGSTETKTSGVGEDTQIDTTSIGLNNILDWGNADLTRKLDSQYSYQDSRGDYTNRSKHWTEKLRWDLGSALQSGLEHDYYSFVSDANEQKRTMERAWLRHQLFDNLSTTLRGWTRKSELQDGTEDQFAGALDFSYTRHLPADCFLAVGLGNSYGETDRALDTDTLAVVNERLIYDDSGFNYLLNYNIEEDSIEVFNETRTVIYNEGVDYQLETIGLRTRIIIPGGSPISHGDVLSIDYQYLVDPSIKYSTESHSLNTSLDLFNRKYRVYANIYQSDEELLGGDAGNVGLNDITEYTLGFEHNLHYFSYGGEYSDWDSTTEKYHYWQGFVEYQRYFKRDFVSVRLRDRQTRYENVSFRQSSDVAGTENSFRATASLRRRYYLLPSAIWETTVDYLRLHGRGNEDDEVTINSAFQVRLGKSRIRLEGEIDWENRDGRTSREFYVILEFRRYF